MLLAIDASPAERMEEWIAGGLLPNLAALRARGAHGRIESTADYLVGSPWPTFNTGSLPPEHGWNYYLTWRPDLMRFVRTTQEWLPIDPFYRNFPLDGPRVIAIDAPHTYAARPFNGVELTGWGAEARVGPPSSFPAGLAERVRRQIGPEPILDEFAGRQTPRQLLVLRDELIAAADWHARVGLMLMREESWDLFILGFGSMHRAGHKVWSHRGTAGALSERQRQELDDVMPQVAIATDRAVGRLMDAAGPDTRIVVFSLHGMMENYSVFPLYARILDRILRGDRRDDPETPPRPLVSRLREAVPLRLRSRIKASLPLPMQDAMTLFWRSNRVDWSRTKAFVLASDIEGLIQVNLKGRERDGIVEPGVECDALLDEIATGFQSFRDLDTGDPFVLDTRRGRDIWQEAVHRHAMPDLVVRNARRSAFGIRGFRSERYGIVRNYDVGGYVDGRSGHHVGEGWFVTGGAGLPAAGRQPCIHELDLLATVHALLGQPMRPGMRGHAVAALLPNGAGTLG
jgi:predicted AlkP superfamily phosphohydrolase/phosphomutase